MFAPAESWTVPTIAPVSTCAWVERGISARKPSMRRIGLRLYTGPRSREKTGLASGEIILVKLLKVSLFLLLLLGVAGRGRSCIRAKFDSSSSWRATGQH